MTHHSTPARHFTVILSLMGIAGILLLTTSCLPDPLEVDSVPRVKQEIVVSTMMVPDRSLLVFLTRTFGALEASEDSEPVALLDFIAVNDALVTIEGPQGKDTLTFIGNGVYGGVLTPFRSGEIYHLYVNSNSLGEVYATTEVKPTIDFQEVAAQLYYNGYNDTLAQVTYTFEDPPQENWYMINVQEIEPDDFLENFLNPGAFTMLLSDEGFNGSAYGEIFRVFPRDYQPGDSIAVSLSNISEEYYEFMKLRIDNRLTFVEFISEPVNYPSNVIGGKGYFNLYVPDIRFFVFD